MRVLRAWSARPLRISARHCLIRWCCQAGIKRTRNGRAGPRGRCACGAGTGNFAGKIFGNTPPAFLKNAFSENPLCIPKFAPAGQTVLLPLNAGPRTATEIKASSPRFPRRIMPSRRQQGFQRRQADQLAPPWPSGPARRLLVGRIHTRRAAARRGNR